MAAFYFIDHYDSFSLNLVDWLTSVSPSLEFDHCFYDEVDLFKRLKMQPKPLVFSPGPKSPSDCPQSLEIMRHFLGSVPILGVCLGHQILGEVLGYEVTRCHRPHHGKLMTAQIIRNGTLFQGYSDQLEVACYNSLRIVGTSPQHQAQITAVNSHGEIMSIESKSRNQWAAYGVQFHPESFLMIHNSDLILKNWNRQLADFQQAPRNNLKLEENILLKPRLLF